MADQRTQPPARRAGAAAGSGAGAVCEAVDIVDEPPGPAGAPPGR
ncbi:hypothetical protein [Kitasatospora phosalacinea]|nr:hypothetical protein [Kitasatospora phosalacinea]